ncbi:MAG: DUF4124 domain-containing protein [Pseudomonadota bacterium]
MTLDDWKPSVPASVDEFTQQILTKGEQVVPSRPDSVYRWQDENGAWHFSDEAPPGSDVQLVEISEANRMPAPEMPPKQTPPASGANVAPFSQIPGMTVSPKQLKETMENLEQLQDKVEKRRLLLDESLD